MHRRRLAMRPKVFLMGHGAIAIYVILDAKFYPSTPNGVGQDIFLTLR